MITTHPTDSAANANAFSLTFVFAINSQPNATKAKESESHRTGSP